MKKTIFSFILATLVLVLGAQGNYYNGVLTLTGNSLLTGLRALISTNTYSSYDGAKVYLFQDLENTNGNVTCIYTGEVYYVGYNYTGSNNPNTEHTYAQSWFSSPSTSIKKADLHHLFPSNSVVNSSRGNFPLYTVANHSSANVYYNDTPWQSYRGNSSTGYTVFEPADETKGNIARALLYFYTRYNDPLTQQNINMLPVLVDWSNQDPPDTREITRNQGVYSFQGNRNPFVDHPEFVNRIWGPVDEDDPVLPAVSELYLNGVWPNPFSQNARISLQSKSSRSANLSVYDIRGRKVKSTSFNLVPGVNELGWDGKDEAGQELGSGIYLLRISSGELNLSARLVLQR